MHTRSMTLSVVASLAALPGLWVCAPAAGQAIIPIDQGRFVSTETVNAPQCGDDFLFDTEAAIGFDPFDAAVQAEHSCDLGFAGATADQQSQIDSSSMSGSATTTSASHALIPGVVHAFGLSGFVVTFEVASSSRFSLDGIMSAGSFPDANTDAIVLARLWEGPIGGVLLFQQSIEPPPGGGINTQPLVAAGALEPGVYTLDIQAGSAIDNEVPPSRSGQTSFSFTFDVTILGDLDGDGTVGILDFLALLAAWGPCPAPPADCPADLDGDGTVGINDFLTLLANWS
ncbi:MAG: hypothetical protein IID28_14445 [Planctomycetes bacterium]|nr:hypothetical protein [Planctomycetota bacterium]